MVPSQPYLPLPLTLSLWSHKCRNPCFLRANQKSTTQVWTNIQGIYQKQNKIRKSTVNGATDVAIKIHHESESIILVEGTSRGHIILAESTQSQHCVALEWPTCSLKYLAFGRLLDLVGKGGMEAGEESISVSNKNKASFMVPNQKQHQMRRGKTISLQVNWGALLRY